MKERHRDLLRYLEQCGIHLVDQRDPIGEERLHTGEIEQHCGISGLRLGQPYGVSGSCTRDPEGYERILGYVLEGALEALQEWNAAGRPPHRRRPIAIQFSNYGASVRTDDRDMYPWLGRAER